jgi:NAD(P)-dependent dehydrogenase (short-subunit alcohol dehydrogenase family)
MDLALQGRTAFVTGASRGIGRAISLALAAEGVNLALFGRDIARCEAVATELRTKYAELRVCVVPLDLERGTAAIKPAIEAAVKELGGVDILVNCAATPGSSGPAPTLATLTDDDLHRELDTKVVGYLRTARAVAPHMAANGWGRIINISGLNARTAGSISGSIRNVAVVALTKNLADELGPLGINVTVVHPGRTITERTPSMLAARSAEAGITPEELQRRLDAGTSIGRNVTADELSDVVVFLASPRSVALTGDVIAAGGGARGPIYY